MSNHDPPQPWEEPHRIGKEPAKDIGVVKGVPISIHIKNGHGSKWLTSRIGCLTFPKKGQTGRAIGVSPWEIPQFMAMFDRTNLWRKNWYSTISWALHPSTSHLWFFRNISSFSPWKWHSPHNRRPPRIHRPRSPPASAPGGRSAAVAGGAKAAPGEGRESWSSPDAPCGRCGCLVVGWPTQKNDGKLVSWDDDIPKIWENKIQVPNHQPDVIIIYLSYCWEDWWKNIGEKRYLSFIYHVTTGYYWGYWWKNIDEKYWTMTGDIDGFKLGGVMGIEWDILSMDIEAIYVLACLGFVWKWDHQKAVFMGTKITWWNWRIKLCQLCWC